MTFHFGPKSLGEPHFSLALFNTEKFWFWNSTGSYD